MPAFINLQQLYLEKALVDRALELKNLDLRWKNRLVGLDRLNDGARLDHRHAGRALPARRRLADRRRRCALDGAAAPGPRLRRCHLRGQILIADVALAAEFPTERRFWFAPTFIPANRP